MQSGKMGTFQRGNPKGILNSQPRNHCEFPTEENPKQERFAFDAGLGNQCYHFVGIQDFLPTCTYFSEQQTPLEEVLQQIQDPEQPTSSLFSLLPHFPIFEMGRIISTAPMGAERPGAVGGTPRGRALLHTLAGWKSVSQDLGRPPAWHSLRSLTQQRHMERTPPQERHSPMT